MTERPYLKARHRCDGDMMVDNEDDVDWESSVRWTAESPDLLALCISFTRDL